MGRIAWDMAAKLLGHAIENHMIPGAAAAAGVGDRVMWKTVQGWAQIEGGRRALREDTRFDLASLTKVMATLPSILVLAGQGQVSLEDPVSRYLSAFRDTRWDGVTLRHLLTHTGGLVSHRNYYESLHGLDAYLAAVAAEPWDGVPGAQVSYSDLGFITLGAVVEAVSGSPLDQFAQDAVFAPLGIDEAGFRPEGDVRSTCAATEMVEGSVLCGIVHDENARAVGGVAGHAGLFGTLQAVSRYAMAWAGSNSLWSPAVRQAATRHYTTGLNGRRGLGWVLIGDSYDVGGDFWPETGAGHTGFTGTSLQFDPVSGIWAVLLTNRVHFGRGTNINPLRRRFHNIVMALLG